MFLSKSDMNILMGNGPKIIKGVPMIRTQGNGNFTGLIVFEDQSGAKFDSIFVENANSKESVIRSFKEHGYRHMEMHGLKVEGV